MAESPSNPDPPMEAAVPPGSPLEGRWRLLGKFRWAKRVERRRRAEREAVDAYRLDDADVACLQRLKRPDPLLNALSIQSSYFTSVYSASWSESSLHQAVTFMLFGWNVITLRLLIADVAVLPTLAVAVLLLTHAMALGSLGYSWLSNYLAFRHAFADATLMPGPAELLSFLRRACEPPKGSDVDGGVVPSPTEHVEIIAVLQTLAPWVSLMQEKNTHRLMLLAQCRRLEFAAFLCSIGHVAFWQYLTGWSKP